MLLKKSRSELDAELFELIKFQDVEPIKEIMRRKFRVDKFFRLSTEETEQLIKILKELKK